MSGQVPRMLRTSTLAERIGCHPETLRRAKDRGELNPVRIGTDLFWPEAEVMAWLESRRVWHEANVVRLDRSSTTRRAHGNT